MKTYTLTQRLWSRLGFKLEGSYGDLERAVKWALSLDESEQSPEQSPESARILDDSWNRKPTSDQNGCTGEYKSSTHGAIPLSARARGLMQALRFAAQEAVKAGDFSANGMALSHARGELAKYMSELERRADVEAVLREELAAVRKDYRELGDRLAEERCTVGALQSQLLAEKAKAQRLGEELKRWVPYTPSNRAAAPAPSYPLTPAQFDALREWVYAQHHGGSSSAYLEVRKALTGE